MTKSLDYDMHQTFIFVNTSHKQLHTILIQFYFPTTYLQKLISLNICILKLSSRFQYNLAKFSFEENRCFKH
jgi:hypothetical protein